MHEFAFNTDTATVSPSSSAVTERRTAQKTKVKGETLSTLWAARAQRLTYTQPNQ